MVYNYKDAIARYQNNYNLMTAIQNGEIIKIENGIYSDSKDYKDLDVFIIKYKNPIFTMESAFYYYGISDVIPEKYNIASNKNGTKYDSPNIKQYFMDSCILEMGKRKYLHLGTEIYIYCKERLLIELIRYKNSLPYDYYKEIINYYRNNIQNIDVSVLFEMIPYFPKKEMIYRILQDEVF